jgi:hypothetical protein
MIRKDTIVWEIVGETFWLVALVGALVLGLLTQSRPTAPRNDQPGSGAVVQILHEAIGSIVFVDVIRLDK